MYAILPFSFPPNIFYFKGFLNKIVYQKKKEEIAASWQYVTEKREREKDDSVDYMYWICWGGIPSALRTTMIDPYRVINLALLCVMVKCIFVGFTRRFKALLTT